MTNQTSNSVTACNCSDSTWTIGSTSNALTSANGLIIGHSGSNGYGSGYGSVNVYNDYEFFGRTVQAWEVFDYLKESEIEDLLSKIFERSQSETTPKDILISIVRARHFSEDFLLNYMEYLTKADIMQQHKRDILSRNYDRICLFFETTEK